MYKYICKYINKCKYICKNATKTAMLSTIKRGKGHKSRKFMTFQGFGQKRSVFYSHKISISISFPLVFSFSLLWLFMTVHERSMIVICFMLVIHC